MADRDKRRKKRKKRVKGGTSVAAHALDQLYLVIDGQKRADPETSDTARLLKRGRERIAKKLGEEAVETLIEGMRGDRFKLILESADLLYHLMALWAVNGVEPKAVWSELALRIDLSKRDGRA
jgi:phosphoribosyl-ATP pyrophosphohydrolase